MMNRCIYRMFGCSHEQITRTFFVWLAISLLTLLFVASSGTCFAQQKKTTADKYLEVLLRRPAPGTALDHVYGYHVQAGTLGELLANLRAQSKQENETEQPSEKPTQANGKPSKQAAAHYVLGLLYARKGDQQNAAKELEKAESLLPNDPMVSFYRGKALIAAGDSGAASQALQRAIERKPAKRQALEVFSELGRLYQRSNQAEKALKVWQQLEETFPGDARVSEQIARTLFDEGQFPEALTRYQKLAQRSAANNDSRAVNYEVIAAELKQRLDRTDEAIKDFESLLTRLRPGSWMHTDVRERIEATFLQSGDYAALADYYLKKSEKNGEDIELQIRLANALHASGRLNEAKETLKKAVELAPSDAEVRMSLIKILKRSGDAATAAVHLETLVKQHPDNPDYLVDLGNTYLEDTTKLIDDREQAAADAWQRLADARSDDPVMTSQVADLMRRISRNDDAIKLYKHAIDLSPDLPQYREYLGQFYLNLGRESDAIKTWNEIAGGDRKNRDNLIRLAEVLHSFQFGDESLAAFTEAAKLDLTFSQRMRFAEMLERNERYQDALSQIDQAGKIAATDDETEQLLIAQIDVYQAEGTLSEKIDVADERAKTSGDAEDYRKLAMMLSAAGRVALAIDAIESAISTDSKSIKVLHLAADLYRDASRYPRAIEIYRLLTKVDKRFLANHLRQISVLHMNLGDVDASLAVAQELIESQPGNPDPLRFYAEQCLMSGRQETGIEKLRAALRVAPRDQEARLLLADTLANAFRTDEAIELYWQTLNATDQFDEQREIIETLALLYERSGDFEKLIRQIQSQSQDKTSSRKAALLTANAYRAVGDQGAALTTLRKLLARNPRDVELLEQIVNLAINAENYRLGLEYQQQLVTLADTPENQRLHVLLLVETGRIEDAKKALSKAQSAENHVHTIELIDRFANQSQDDIAIELCESLLNRDSGLWEVQVRLAMLLYKTGDKVKAGVFASELLAMSLPPDRKSELAKASRREGRRGGRRSNQADGSSLSAASRVNNRALVSAVLKRLGKFNPNSRNVPKSRLVINRFRDARIAAITVKHVIAEELNRTSVTRNEMVAYAQKLPISEVEKLWFEYEVDTTISDAKLLKVMARQTTYRTTRSTLTLPTILPTMGPGPTQDILWRIAEIDEAARPSLVEGMIKNNGSTRTVTSSGVTRVINRSNKRLTDKQIEIAEQAFAQIAKQSNPRATQAFAVSFHRELLAAGFRAKALALARKFTGSVDTPSQAHDSLQFALSTRDASTIGDLLDRIQHQIPSWSDTITANQCNELLLVLRSVNSVSSYVSTSPVSADKNLQTIDLIFAVKAIQQHKGFGARSGNTQSTTMTVRIRDSSTRRVTSTRVNVPSSSSLMAIPLANSTYLTFQCNTSGRLRSQLTEYLKRNVPINDNPDIARLELKLRRCMLTFVHEWSKNQSLAFKTIAQTSEDFPDDHNLAIEYARYAVKARQSALALQILDGINSIDQGTLKARELMAIDLAIRLGKPERAKSAAKILFGMKLDAKGELKLADQLTSLGEQPMAIALMHRSRGSAGRTVDEQILIAQRFLDADDRATAAEVAVEVFRKMKGSSDRNVGSQRTKILKILAETGQLEELVARAEKRAASSPDSYKIQTDLAELYDLVGRREQANEIYERMLRTNPNAAKEIWKKGNALLAARQYPAAAATYIKAIRYKPELINQDTQNIMRAALSGRATDDLFSALVLLDPAKIEPHTFEALTSLTPTVNSFTENYLRTVHVDRLAGLLKSKALLTASRRNTVFSIVAKRIFEDPKIYDPKHPVWATGNVNSSGQFEGIYSNCMLSAIRNSSLEFRVRELIEAQVREPKTSSFAQILSSGLPQPSLTDQQIVDWIDELMKENAAAPYQLWWQVAESLNAGNRKLVAIAVMNHVQSKGVDPGHSDIIRRRLASLHADVGQKEDARQALWQSYQESIVEEIPVKSPSGAAPVALPSTALAIRAKYISEFEKLGLPFDSLRVCNETIQRHQEFRSVLPTTANNVFSDKIRETRDRIIANLTERDFAEYLVLAESATNEFRVIPMAQSGQLDPSLSSVAAYVVAELAKTEGGRKRLSAFRDSFTSKLDSDAKNLDLLSLKLLVGLALEQRDIAKDIDAATKRVGSKGEQNTFTGSRLSLYSPVMVALNSSRTELVSASESLSEKLVDVAEQRKRSAIAANLLLSRAARNDDQAIRDQASEVLLSSLDVVTQGKSSPVDTTTATECVEIAELAADHGLWTVAIEAVRRGWAGGDAKQAYPSTPNARPNPFQQRSVKIDHSRMKRLITRFAKAEDAPRDSRTYQALKEIVLGPATSKGLFPYWTQVIDDAEARATKFSRLQLSKVTQLLAEVAVKSNNADDLQQDLLAVRDQSKTPHEAVAVLVQIAAERDDEDNLSKHLESLGKTLKPYIKTDGATSADAVRSLLTIGEAKNIVDILLHVIKPLHQRETLPAELIEMEMDVLRIASTDKECCLAAEALTWITRELASRKEVSDSHANQATELCLAATKLRYGNFSSTHAQENYQKQSLRLLRSSLMGRRDKTIAALLRNFANYRPGYQSSSDSFAQISMDLLEFDDEYRHKVLSGMIFGADDDSEQIVSTSGLRLMAEPPESLRPATPFLDRAKNLPVAHRSFPITSAALLLAETANRCGKTDATAKRLRKRIESPGDEVDAMLGSVLLAAGRIDEVAPILERVGKAITDSEPSKSLRTPMPMESALLIAGCLSNDQLREQATPFWKPLVSHALQRNLGLTISFFNRVAADISNPGGLNADSKQPLDHWINVQLPFFRVPTVDELDARYWFDADGKLSFAAGSDQSVLMLKYPVMGEFTFSHKNLYQRNGESSCFYGGTNYIARGRTSLLYVRALTSRNGVSIPQKLTKQYSTNILALRATDAKVEFLVNQSVAAEDSLTSTMPFAGIFFHGNMRGRLAEIAISGSPTIPREVNLLGKQLRGWSCPIIDGRLVAAHLPIGPNDFLANVKSTRLAAQQNASKNTNWFFDGYELRTGDRSPDHPDGLLHLQYARPLLSDETWEYEFFYEPDKTQVHPTVGRVAAMVRDGKIGLRWLRQERSLESFQSIQSRDFDVDEMIAEPKLQTRGWNRVTIVNEGKKYLLKVNGKDVARFGGGLDRRIGFLCEPQHECRVRQAKLSGPWPEKLPSDLMQTK